MNRQVYRWAVITTSPISTEGTSRSAYKLGPVKFTESLRVSLIEEDGGFNGDNDILWARSTGTTFPRKEIVPFLWMKPLPR